MVVAKCHIPRWTLSKANVKGKGREKVVLENDCLYFRLYPDYNFDSAYSVKWPHQQLTET